MNDDGRTPWRARISALAVDREKGAATIARLSAEALAEGAKGGAPAKPLQGALVELIHGQHAMAPVLRLAADLSAELKSGATKSFLKVAERWVVELSLGAESFQEKLCGSIKSADTWAFFSFSSTVHEGLEALSKAGVIGNAIVGESRPGGEGALTARRLTSLGWKTRLVPDSRLMDLVQQGVPERMILGCDGADGKRFINKTGSAALAALARKAKVTCELWTTTHKLVPPATLDLLHGGQTQGDDLRPFGEDVSVDQPLFGFGDMSDVNTLRTERGRMRPKDVALFLDSLPALDTSLLELS